jgi:hypothetical protein
LLGVAAFEDEHFDRDVAAEARRTSHRPRMIPPMVGMI